MNNGLTEPSPHDLLWLERERLVPAIAGGTIPGWVRKSDGPVVVRRDQPPAGWVPVGVRGDERSKRFAAFAPLDAIQRCLTPFELAANRAWLDIKVRRDYPVIRALNNVAGVLERLKLDWGITGSVAYELATGESQMTAHSDLDLTINQPTRLCRSDAQKILDLLSSRECRIDAQLETVSGAVALSDWAETSGKVLLKTNSGPRLVNDPWAVDVDE